MPLLLSRDSWIESRAISRGRVRYCGIYSDVGKILHVRPASQKTNTIIFNSMCFLYTPSSPNLGLNIPKNMHVAKFMMSLKKTTCSSVADVKIDIKI